MNHFDFDTFLNGVQGLQELSTNTIVEEVDEDTKKTILLIDTSLAEESLYWFQNSERCVVLDGEKLHLARTMRKCRLQVLLEGMEFYLYLSRRHSLILYIYLTFLHPSRYQIGFSTCHVTWQDHSSSTWGTVYL